MNIILYLLQIIQYLYQQKYLADKFHLQIYTVKAVGF